MSHPTAYPAGHPQRERDQREAEGRYESACAGIWRDTDNLVAALADTTWSELAGIARLAQSDPAAAGERLRVFARNAVHDYARFLGECSEEIPPASEWNFPPARTPSDWAASVMGLDAHVAAARGIPARVKA